MVFNEIIIPQDSFTETNVTRKKSVVGNPRLFQKNKKLISANVIIFERYLGINFNFLLILYNSK